MGFGIQLSELRFKSDYLVSAVEKILTQNTYKDKAVYYKNKVESYNGPERAVQLI